MKNIGHLNPFFRSNPIDYAKRRGHEAAIALEGFLHNRPELWKILKQADLAQDLGIEGFLNRIEIFSGLGQ